MKQCIYVFLAAGLLAGRVGCGQGLKDSLSLSKTLVMLHAGIKTDSQKTGILYDHIVYPGVFDLPQSQRDTLHSSLIRQAVYELAKASTDGKPGFTTAHYALEKVRYKYRDTRLVPIAVVDAAYDRVDTLAASKGLVRLAPDSALESVPGTTASPFVQDKGLLISLLPFNHELESSTDSIIFDPDAIVSNTGRQVQSITCTKPNGEIVVLTPGQKTPISQGDRVFYSFTVNFTDGSNGTSTVESVTSADTSSADFKRLYPPNYEVGIKGYPFTEGTTTYPAYTGTKFGYTILSYFYRNSYSASSPSLQKPILIVDGFDPGNTRWASKTYGKYLRYYPTGQNSAKLLGDFLRQSGFDVIIADFPDYTHSTDPTLADVKKDHGGGMVEQNALAIVAAIQRLNGELRAANSTEKLVIVGPSMGGLITRYALAYMEKKEAEYIAAGDAANAALWHHNCRLWCSFDSPHLGANIPVSSQMFLRFFGEDIGKVEANDPLVQQIRSIAAMQMLVHHESALPLTFGGDPNYRNAFVTSLNSNGLPNSGGFPQHLKKIVLINGALNGLGVQDQNNALINPGQKVLELRASALQLRWQNRIISLFLGLWAHELIAEYVPLAKADIYAAPAASPSASVNVFYGWVSRLTNFRFGHANERNWGASSLDGGASLDLAPGGTFMTNAIISEEPDRTHNIFYRMFGHVGAQDFTSVATNHNFIPSKSSLALRSGLANLGEDLSNRDLVCSGETPFDDYINTTSPNVQLNNWPHVSLSGGAVDWIFEHLNNAQMPRRSTHVHIRGDESICLAGTQKTYSLIVPSRFTVTGPTQWTNYTGFTSPASDLTGIQLLSPSGSGSINLLVSSTAALASGVQCPIHSSKVIEYGAGSSTLQITPRDVNLYQQTSSNLNTSKLLSIRDVAEATSYQWYMGADETEFPDGYSDCINIDNTSITTTNHPVTISPNLPTTTETCTTSVSVVVHTACGIKHGSVSVHVTKLHGTPQHMGVAPPTGHPGIKNAEVSIRTEDGGITIPACTEVRMLDERGNLVMKACTDIDGTAVFDLTDIKPAMYSFSATTQEGDPVDADWAMLPSPTSRLLISPNPAISGIDDKLQANIVADSVDEGPYWIALYDNAGATRYTGVADWDEFTLDASTLEPGGYLLHVEKKDGSIWEDSLDVLMKDAPHLNIFPNPTQGGSDGSLTNFVDGLDNLTLRVVDPQGITRWEGVGNAHGFNLPINNLPPALYQVVANDGNRNYTLLLRKQ